MAHDRLKHVSIFRSGTGAVIIANDTLGPINQNTGWLTDHLEMALAAYTSTPEQQHEILHPIPKMPWTNAAGQRLNTLQIRLARVEEIAYPVLFMASEGAEWTTGAILDANGASYLRT